MIVGVGVLWWGMVNVMWWVKKDKVFLTTHQHTTKQMSMDNRRSGYQPQQMTRQRSFSTAADKQRDNYYITVPNAVVGALIGTAGSNIKQIIRDSNSLVTVRDSVGF